MLTPFFFSLINAWSPKNVGNRNRKREKRENGPGDEYEREGGLISFNKDLHVTCKILEGLVRQKLVEHLTDNNLVTDYQHGFVSGRSCSTNLLAVLDAWTETLENEGCVDTVYLDFAKAFDTVPHERLLRKFEWVRCTWKDINLDKEFPVRAYTKSDCGW